MIRIRVIVTILFFLLFEKPVSAIDCNSVDSLKSRLETVSGKEKMDTFLKLCEAYVSINPQKTIHMGHQALALAQNLGYETGIARSLYFLGVGYTRNGQYDNAMENLLKALRYCESKNLEKELGDALYYLAVVCKEMGNYPKQLKYSKKALKIFEKTGSLSGKGKVLNILGLHYKREGEYDKALDYLNKSMNISKELGNEFGVSLVMNNIGNVRILKGDTLRAVSLFKQALEILNKTQYSYNRGSMAINLGSLYLELGDNKKAEQYFEMGRKVAQRIKSNKLWQHYYINLSALYKSNRDFEKALEYFVKSEVYKDSIFNDQLANKTSDLLVKHAVEIKNQENKLLRKENLIQQLEIKSHYIIGLSVLLLLSLVIWGLIIRYRSKIKDNELLFIKNRLGNKHQKELIEAMKKLQDSQENLREANETKDKMFSLIAHDLRGSVGNICNGLKMLLNDHELELTEDDKHEFLETIYNSAGNSFELLENLLFWARSQSYSLKVNLEYCDLTQLVESNIKLLAELAKIKSIQLIVSSDEHVEVYVDRNMILTVFRNLISNAIKFTNKGGEVEITTQLKGDGVRVSVRDNGIGMKPQQLKNIYKGKTTDGTANEKGSGLGLSLCRDFLAKHECELIVESQLDKGSCFSFVLPVSGKMRDDNEQLMPQESLISSLNS